MLGYDAAVFHSTDWRAGLGVGMAQTRIDGRIFEVRTDVRSTQALAYVGYEPGAYYLYGSVGVDWNSYVGTRHIEFEGFDRTARGEYNGRDITAYVKTGYHFYYRGNTITPLASLQYSNAKIGDYTEAGAGAVDLSVEKQNYSFLESGLGVRLARQYNSGTKSYVPEIHAKWLRAINNPTLETTSTFVDGTEAFTTPGYSRSANMFNVGLGVGIITAEAWTLEAAYDYDFRRDKYTAHKAMAKITYHF